MDFQLDQNSLDVCKVINEYNSEIRELTIISHEVCLNWRQLYQTNDQKSKNLSKSLNNLSLLEKRIYSRDEFNELELEFLSKSNNHLVWSMISKVKCSDKKNKHIPMMNFHPDGASLEDIRNAIKYICDDDKGVLLNSGRFQHYYGISLIEQEQWYKFMGKFLTPCILVSPRYIGLRLCDGYSTLRLTSDNEYKPKIPRVIEIL